MGDDKWHRDSDVMLRTPEHDEAQYLDGAAAPRPRPYPALNWKSVLAPAPASAFFSAAPSPRLYAERSSPDGARAPPSGIFGLGRAGSGRVCLFRVDGTISGGR